jgi:hypothetical protein
MSLAGCGFGLDVRAGPAIAQGDAKDLTDTGASTSASLIATAFGVLGLGVRGGYAYLPVDEQKTHVSGSVQTFLLAPEIRAGLLAKSSPLQVFASAAPGYVHLRGERDLGDFEGERDQDRFGIQAGGTAMYRFSESFSAGVYLDYQWVDLERSDQAIEFLTPGVAVQFGF